MPVVHLENLHMLLAYTTLCDFKIDQMDMDSAFLQADLSKTVFVKQPEGFMSQTHPDYVCRLNKSLYRLKQAPLMWNHMLDKHLHVLQFQPLEADLCIYIRKQGGNISVVSIYIDNCLIISRHPQVNKIKTSLAKKFKIKDLGPVNLILGIEVLHNCEKGTTCLHQSSHIDSLLAKFNMADAKPVTILLQPGLSLTKINKTPKDCYTIPYQQAIGKLLYIAIASRPNIAFSVAHLSHFINAYNHTHWEAAKSVICYLKGMCEQILMYSKQVLNQSVPPSDPLLLVGYCDADWSRCIIDRKSIFGYVFTLAGGPIMWASKTQTTVALSSSEAELNAMSKAMKQVLYICKLLPPLGINDSQPISLANNNQSSLMLATQSTLTFQAQMKHYNIKLHHLHDTTMKGLVSVHYCPTKTMPTDILTKALPRLKLEELKLLLNLHMCQLPCNGGKHLSPP